MSTFSDEERQQEELRRRRDNPSGGGATSPGVSVAAKLVVFAAVFGGLVWLFSPSSPSTPAEKAREAEQVCNNKFQAYEVAKRFVEQRLKAPATAKWPDLGDPGVTYSDVGTCHHKFTSYVDAQNSFGANIRTPFSVELTYDFPSEKWVLQKIETP